MKMATAVRLLQLLPTRPERALSAADIAAKWYPDKKPGPNDMRSVFRYVNELAGEGMEGPALIEVIDGAPRRYYLKLSGVAEWFMTEAVALNVLLTWRQFEKMLATAARMDMEQLNEVAETVAGASQATRRIRDRVRLVPDGIGRVPAFIDQQVLQTALSALGANQKLKFTYAKANGVETTSLVSPHGLVAKDGTIYLLATRGLEDTVIHFALHRMRDAHAHSEPLRVLDGFDLDRYIELSHQLSHPLDNDLKPVSLRLRVAPETIYHFRERPLSENQTITPPQNPGAWYIVTAGIPDTILLVPFLLSMGGWIEVLEPASIRDEMARRLRDAARHYVAGDNG